MIIIDIPTPVKLPTFNPSIVGNALEKIFLSTFRYQIVGTINIQNLQIMKKIWEWSSLSKISIPKIAIEAVEQSNQISIPKITEIEGTNATRRIAIKELLRVWIFVRIALCKKIFLLHLFLILYYQRLSPMSQS